MKRIIVSAYFCSFFSIVCFGNNRFIEPSNDFSINFCNFPYAWSVTKGKDVNIGIVYANAGKSPNWISKVLSLVPESEVRRIKKTEFLLSKNEIFNHQVILLLEAFREDEYQQALTSIRKSVESGTVVLLPAYFGPIKKSGNYKAWHKFVKESSQKGAIIVGIHGQSYQLGDLSFWKVLPVDIYVLNPRIDGDRYFKPDAMIDVDVESSTYLAAGTAALLKSIFPKMPPAQIKRVFRERGRKVYSMHVDTEWEGNKVRIDYPAKLSKESIKEYQIDLKLYQKKHPEFNPKTEEVIDLKFNCLDASLILGLKTMGDGEWAYQVLNVTEAQKIATGKGVIVAILDHMFDKEDKSFQHRLVRPASVLQDAPVFGPEVRSGHGTWMARVLVKVAPDVKIMPVRICGNGIYGDAELYIKGIEYAIENGANIVCLSQQAIPREKQQDLDGAIKKATEKGVTFVYINYQGKRKDVIVTSPVEFANRYNKNNKIFVIGTNFINESSFPYTWGVSQTAPMVAGVIAILKELNSELIPFEIKNILFESYNTISSGYPILDALKAVKKIRSK
jgi:hypothetical protein